MLKLKHLVENYDLAKEALQNWHYDEKDLDSYLSYFRISSNAIYPFPWNGKCCFLRLAPVEEKLLRNIQGELEFIQYLRKNEYPALEPIPSKNGEYILTLNTPWGSYYATAFYGVPGEQIEDSDFSEKVCFAYGKALGKLHALSQAFEPSTKKQDYQDILNSMEQQLCGNWPLLEKLNLLRRRLAALQKDSMHYGLVHYDFECDNVFYEADSGSCHVIDFDDGVYHFYALDIEQALDSIDEEAGDKAENAKAAFLNGYKTEFLYDEAIVSSLPLMRMFCDFYSYTRILHCLSESVPEEPDWMISLKEKLNRKADILLKKITKWNS